MKPYSLDVRTRVLAALDRGMSRPEAVTIFQVSVASLKRWLTARRATGTCAPRPATGGRPRVISVVQDAYRYDQVLAFPDARLTDHAALWNAAHGTTLSLWSLGRAIRRLELTRKKSH